MQFRTKHSPLLLLLLPSLASALAAVPASSDNERRTVAAPDPADDASPPASLKGRIGVPTKDAPVDGKDGKPHLGPFVETDGASPTSNDLEDLPQLKGRPKDPTIVDGKKIPESNDGVMFDKNRERPQEGTTGTEGGVSEKDKARKAHEGKTGEKAVTQPEAPKEQPPLPHSEEKKIDKGKDKSKTSDSDKDKDRSKSSSDKGDSSVDYTGLEKPDDLPDMQRENSPPVPNSAQKDHLDISKPKTGSSSYVASPTQQEADDGIIQPFHSFVLSFTMILVSEVGDKTFLIAALMAMKHDRMLVFSAAFGALLVMTVLSAVLGHAVPALIPKRLTGLLAAGLFFVFGARLLREGMQMDPNEGVTAEMHEVEQELAEKEKELERKGGGSSMSPHALEMGLGGRGARGSKRRFPSPPRSPSQSPTRTPLGKSQGMGGFLQSVNNLCSLILSPAWVQTFIMTFLGEWGDRSQIATIAMAAGQDYWWVTLGALAGHCICTGVAVIGGRAIAGRVSLKVVTVGGAVAFLLFGFIYLIEAIYS